VLTREDCIEQLVDEIARLKAEKGKPKIKPSRLEPKEKKLLSQLQNLILTLGQLIAQRASSLGTLAEPISVSLA
jgi:hypothetical protein